MNSIALVMVVVGVVIFFFSSVIKFKPIDYELDENEKNENNDEKSEQNDDDFKMLLESSKAFVRIFGFFIILIGIALYFF